jgi:3-hydroxybutyryl-CoA dehydrogenase/5-formyl-3-hydroxy-2-methylpyridine 4-carboxylate dehydrogenase
MIRSVALLGLGTMGPGIAARLARGGLTVAAYDSAPAQYPKAEAMLPAIRGVLDRLEVVQRPGGALRFADNLADALAGADLVIENIPEDEALKAALYRNIDPLIGPATLVVSDTSGIPITRLQAHISNPARFCGMHWSNPPHIIPMIEVIGGAGTAPATTAAIRDLILALGLLPVTVKKDLPGFVENRVLYALLRETVDLVEQGVIAPEDIDTCVSWGIGFKLAVVGPMALLDMAGLDIYRSVARFLNAELSARTDIAPMIEAKAAAGRLGLKTQGGIYDYTPERITALQQSRARKLVAIRRILEEAG